MNIVGSAPLPHPSPPEGYNLTQTNYCVDGKVFGLSPLLSIFTLKFAILYKVNIESANSQTIEQSSSLFQPEATLTGRSL